jgi:hypothetical protein
MIEWLLQWDTELFLKIHLDAQPFLLGTTLPFYHRIFD